MVSDVLYISFMLFSLSHKVPLSIYSFTTNKLYMHSIKIFIELIWWFIFYKRKNIALKLLPPFCPFFVKSIRVIIFHLSDRL